MSENETEARDDELVPVPRKSGNAVRALVVEDGQEDAENVERLLKSRPLFRCEVTCVDRLEHAFEALAAEPYDVVLLDLFLPDSQGLETVIELCRQVPGLPAIAITGMQDEELALRSVQHGAQDYLLKDELNGDLLVRTIRHSIERHRLVECLRAARMEVSALEALLPMCPSCKMVRTEKGTWMQMDHFLRCRTGIEISDALCPRCTGALYTEMT